MPAPVDQHREPGEFPISGHGRQRLLDTALVLLDERGIDGVSARAIAQASGHRNVAAVNYHFGSLDQLIRAVVARHAEVVDRGRQALLDDLEARGEVSPRDAMDAMLRPLVDQLVTLEGRRYLRLLNHAANHPAYYAEGNLSFTPSAARGAAHLASAIAHVPAEVRAIRTQNALGAALYALSHQARVMDSEAPVAYLSPDDFGDDLVTTLLAALQAPATPGP
jgi:AcrR family transcriptional regulator